MKKIRAKIKKMYFSQKLKIQMWELFACIFVCDFLILAVCFGTIIHHNSLEYNKKINSDVLISISDNMQKELKSMSLMSRMIIYSDEVLSFLNEKNSTSYDTSYHAIKKMYGIVADFSNVSSVYIFKNNGKSIHIASRRPVLDKNIINEKGWKEKVREKAGGYLITLDGDGAFTYSNGEHMISLARVINDPSTQNEVGIIVINYSMDLLHHSLENVLSNDSSLQILNGTGDYLYGNLICGEEELEQISYHEGEIEFIEGSNGQVLCYYGIDNFPFILVKQVAMYYQNYFSAPLLLLLILIVTIVMINMAIFGVFTSSHITHPIEKLVQTMQRTKEGWLYRISMQTPSVEMKILKNGYNEMLIEVNRLISELVEKEKAAQQAKLEVLLEQVNPHFLYNTLETIEYLALENPREEVYDAVVSLGEYYRSFLNNGEDMITVKEEVSIVRNYLKLQKLRYEDVFEDEYDIDDSLLQYKVPKLILQPLVENSLYHGLRPKGEKGVIRISVKKAENNVLLNVYDTGIGMSEDTIQKVLAQDTGFGLRRTLQRIQFIYEMDIPFKLESKVGYYCDITLSIPYKEVKTDVSSDNCR